ncbi:MAG: hypothetical protein AAFU34_18095 [Pseudomonadota bacterium]
MASYALDPQPILKRLPTTINTFKERLIPAVNYIDGVEVQPYLPTICADLNA